MKSDERIVSYTLEELAAQRAAGQDRTQWETAVAMTDDQIAAAIASDADEAGMVVDWAAAKPGVAGGQPTTIRLDSDVLDFFQGTGHDYQAAINAVLRSYIAQVRR